MEFTQKVQYINNTQKDTITIRLLNLAMIIMLVLTKNTKYTINNNNNEIKAFFHMNSYITPDSV